MEINDTDICANCYREFAEHNYVPDSITDYRCPHGRQESAYGYFHGGDPRDFHPDYESCTEQEIENHRKACELWNEAEARGETPEPEECGSCLKASYGIGVNIWEIQTLFEPLEHDEEWSEEDDD